jgi:hypothetical protein
MHETHLTARIGSGRQKGCQFFGDLSMIERRRSIRRRAISAATLKLTGARTPIAPIAALSVPKIPSWQ